MQGRKCKFTDQVNEKVFVEFGFVFHSELADSENVFRTRSIDVDNRELVAFSNA